MDRKIIRVAVVGAAGRMGRRLVTAVLAAEDMELSGALEIEGSTYLGKDAGTVAGCEACGVNISTDFQSLLKVSDAVIDFSTGKVLEHARMAAESAVSIVIGSTGIPQPDRDQIAKLAKNGARIVLASNMSVGVNLLMNLCRTAASVLSEEYDIEIVEMHHRMKKDAPSGTALSLAESVAQGRNISLKDKAIYGREGLSGERPAGQIGIHAVRGGDVVGDHTVIFATEGERIELVHKASNRDTFVKGAIRAVRFLQGAPPGLYSMRDVLGLK